MANVLRSMSLKPLLASLVLGFSFSLTGCNGISAGGYFEMAGSERQVGETCLCRGENCACAPEATQN